MVLSPFKFQEPYTIWRVTPLVSPSSTSLKLFFDSDEDGVVDALVNVRTHPKMKL